MPLDFNWRCDHQQCRSVISGPGIASLSLRIREHDLATHWAGEEDAYRSRTYDEIINSRNFYKMDLGGSTPTRVVQEPIPTLEDMRFLKHARIEWVGDNRSPLELAARYRNNL